MTYVLDTDIVSFALKRTSESVVERIRAFQPGELKISVITRFELEYGLRRRPDDTSLRKVVYAFLRNIEILGFSEESAVHSATIRAELTRIGKPIGAYDLLIAGQARALGATLVTHNRREFDRVPGLKTEDWTDGTAT